MSAEPESSPRASVLAVEYERGAERVRAAIAVALEPGAGFAERVEAALRVALGLLAEEPALAHLLLLRPFAVGLEGFDCYERWQRRAADALREEAARDPDAYAHPSFFEPVLVSELCALVARRLAIDPSSLEESLPDLLELVNACYFGPQRPAWLVDA